MTRKEAWFCTSNVLLGPSGDTKSDSTNVGGEGFGWGGEKFGGGASLDAGQTRVLALRVAGPGLFCAL